MPPPPTSSPPTTLVPPATANVSSSPMMTTTPPSSFSPAGEAGAGKDLPAIPDASSTSMSTDTPIQSTLPADDAASSPSGVSNLDVHGSAAEAGRSPLVQVQSLSESDQREFEGFDMEGEAVGMDRRLEAEEEFEVRHAVATTRELDNVVGRVVEGDREKGTVAVGLDDSAGDVVEDQKASTTAPAMNSGQGTSTDSASIPLAMTKEPDDHVPIIESANSPLVPTPSTSTAIDSVAPAPAPAAVPGPVSNFTRVEPTTSPTPPIPSTSIAVPPSSTSQTPISAIRPGFMSRHSSSKSISSLLPPRSERKDPSPSRPFSMGWLREKSRSHSRSRSRSSRNTTGSQGWEATTVSQQPAGSSLAASVMGKSTPGSLALEKTEEEGSSGAGAEQGGAASGFNLNDFSDVAVRPDLITGVQDQSMASPTRTEAWNSPDATLPPRPTSEEGSKKVGRLGILPSPAPTATTSEGGRRASLEPSRRRSSAAAWRSSSDENGTGAQAGLEPVPSEESIHEETTGGTEVAPALAVVPVGRTTPLRRVSEASVPPVDDLKEKEEEEVVVMQPRPQQQRKASDRETLPSQQLKRNSMGRPRPDSMVLANWTFASEDSVDRVETPGEVKRRSGMVAEPDAVFGAERDGVDRAAQLPTASQVSPPISPEVREDAMSDVSAEGDRAQDNPLRSTRPTISRHSSVSSLGVVDGDPVEPSSMGRTSVAQSLASNNIDSTTQAAAPGEGSSQQVLGLLSPARPQMPDRPMSYTTLPRDESGLPVPETISRAPLHEPLGETVSNESQAEPVPVDLSVMAGSPVDTTPFEQRPVARVAETEQDGDRHEGERANIVLPDQAPLPQQDVAGGSVPPQQDYFSKERSTPAVMVPRRDQISDFHGLEDVHALDQVTPGAESQEEDKQSRRRSGIWRPFHGRRGSSFMKGDDSSKRSSMAALDPSSGNENSATVETSTAKSKEDLTKRGTLQKQKRTQSTIIETAPKKKRFSALGSIFKRSSSTVDTSAKPKKLTKTAPSQRDSSTAQSPAGNDRPANHSTVSGDITSYAQYEAMRKGDAPAFQETTANLRRQSAHPPRTSSQSNTFDRPSAQPPPGGWYGPASQEENYQRPFSPPLAGQSLPEHRRLHSEGQAGYRPAINIPEAFRPVEASYNVPVDPIGPPPSQNHPADHGYVRRQSQEQSRYTLYGAAFPESHGDGPPPPRPRSDFPSYDRDGPYQYYPTPQQRSYRPESGRPSREMVRSPVQDYNNDQQTPWTLAIPRNEQESYSAQWTTSPEGQHPANSPPDQIYHHDQRQQENYYQQGPPPASSRRSSAGAYSSVNRHSPERPPQMYDNPPPPRSYTAEPASYYPDPRNYPYSSAPYQDRPPPPSQQLYDYPPQRPHSAQYGGGPPPPPQGYNPRPRPQNRYYAQYASPPPPGSRPYFPPRRPGSSSGYTGRRDDPTVGEEEVIMRGASYPGQEWQPVGMGRWD